MVKPCRLPPDLSNVVCLLPQRPTLVVGRPKPEKSRLEWLNEYWPTIVKGPDELVDATAKNLPGGAIYFLWGAAGELLYIGISKQPMTRLYQHRRTGMIDFAKATAISIRLTETQWNDYIHAFETAYIVALDPPLNSGCSGAWIEQQAEMQAAIAAKWGK